MLRSARNSRAPVAILCELLSAATLALVLGSSAHADSQTVYHILDADLSDQCKDAGLSPPSIVANRYVLLLFFANDSATTGQVDNLFHTVTDPDPTIRRDGCYPDSKGKTQLLRVQGGCPTDCVKPPQKLLAKENPSPDGKARQTTPQAPGGDPLNDPTKPGQNVWGLFFADPGGSADNADKDDNSRFLVWQIVVEDSLQAGRIIHHLYNDKTTAKLFSNKSKYRGQLMVAYSP
jgi:hypothetical protein